jgi:uncharacterized protein YndB with AHSA1/START domain
MQVTVEALVNAPIENVWEAWTTPAVIQQWNAASDDWCCPKAEIDLHEGGLFDYRMESKTGAQGFNFSGHFTRLKLLQRIEYTLTDGRQVAIFFSETADGVLITETFDTSSEYSTEAEKEGWQSILNYFKKVVETNQYLS